MASEPNIQKSFFRVMKKDHVLIKKELDSFAKFQIEYTNRRRNIPNSILKASDEIGEDSGTIREIGNNSRAILGSQEDSGAMGGNQGESGAKGGMQGCSGAKGEKGESGAMEEVSGAMGGKEGESGAMEEESGAMEEESGAMEEESGAMGGKEGESRAMGMNEDDSGVKGEKDNSGSKKDDQEDSGAKERKHEDSSSKEEMQESSGAIRKLRDKTWSKKFEFTPNQKLKLKYLRYNEPPNNLSDVTYPIPIHNVAINCQVFDLDKNCEKHLYHQFDYDAVKSSFTSFVLSYDLQFYRSQTEPIPGESNYVSITNEQDLLNLNRMEENNLILHEGEFVEEYYATRPYIIMEIRNANPICILTGKDILVNPFENCSSPTIMFEHNINEMNKTLANLPSKEKISKKLRKHELCDAILYYYRNKMINIGGIYWIAQENQTVYLHDFTSTFHLKLVQNFTDAFHAMKNAYGLHYLYMAKNGCRLNEDRIRLFTPLRRVIDRSIAFINKNDYPAEYCLANLIRSEIYISSNIDFCNPSLVDDSGAVNVERRLGDEIHLHHTFTTYVMRSLGNLNKILAFLLVRHNLELLFPIDSENLPGEEAINFNFDRFLNDLITNDPSAFKEFSPNEFEKNVFKPFMADTRTENFELRMVVHVLRKIFSDSLAYAMVNQMLKRFGISMYYSELALKAWIAMTKLISLKQPFPLPLQPMFILGEILYKFTSLSDLGNKEYNKFYNQQQDCQYSNNLKAIFSTKDKRCFSASKSRFNSTDVMTEAFKYFARCILFTNVEPNIHVLSSLCDASCFLADYYLDICNERRPYFTSKDFAKVASDRILKLLKLFDHFNYEVFSLYNISMAKGKYFKIHAESIIEKYQMIDERAFCRYRKAIKFYQKAMEIAKNLITNKPILDTTLKEYLDASSEFIWMLKEAEDQDRISYHLDVLGAFNKILGYCFCVLRARVTHMAYFQYRSAIYCALLAEYFYGLYRDCGIYPLRKQTVKWFQTADHSFRTLNKVTVIEVFKVNIDFVSFCQSVIAGLEEENESHIMMLDQIMACLPYLISANKNKLFGGTSDLKTFDINVKRHVATFHGLYKIFLKQVKAAMVYRAMRLNNEKTIASIDIPENRVTELFRDCIQPNCKDPSYLINLLKKIKKIRDNFLNQTNVHPKIYRRKDYRERNYN